MGLINKKQHEIFVFRINRLQILEMSPFPSKRKDEH